ncbi:MAG TPA: hypothetical protein VN408_31030 [Actinoplanes sp.]|nr:hypothetical protein [Actinoplanes sp.]
MWLFTDTYPQGKDLYDAVLLAERFTADLDLVRELSEPDMGADLAECGLGQLRRGLPRGAGDRPPMVAPPVPGTLRYATRVAGSATPPDGSRPVCW